MEIRIKDLPFEATALRGLSEKLLRSHHQNNYGGAVKRLNAIRSQLAGLPFQTAHGPTSCLLTARSSSIASTVTRSAEPPRCACARPV
jgi:hypothetical protein